MSDELLSASGEAAWQALRQHIEWTQGFWSGWVFTDYTPSVHELHRRVEALLRGVGRKTVLRQPREPGELVDVLLWLNAGADGCDGCVIVAVVQSGDAWRDAWEQLMLRLNERRELLRANIRGGLLLCAPMSFKVRTREAAPDLWSIRSLALEVAPLAGEMPEARRVARSEPEAAEGSETQVTLALQAVNAALRAGQVDAEVDARIRTAEALFAVGRRDEGREQAVAAVGVAASDRSSSRALMTLAHIERELGDLIAAERHYRVAIDANGEAAGVWAYLYLVDILMSSHALAEAQRVAEAGLTVAREKRERLGEAPEAVRDEAESWGRIGRVREAQGDWSGAGEAYDARLTLTRLLRSKLGDTPYVLRDELVAWLDVGDVRRAKGDLSGAGEAYDASLALSRQVRAMMGDTAHSLRDEVMCLDRLGSLRRDQKNLEGAKDAYEASLGISRCVRQIVGDTAEGLRDVAASLVSLSDVQWAQGSLAEATAGFEEGLGLFRQITGVVGTTADALLDEAGGVERLGRVSQVQGDSERALALRQECLGLIRQARKSAGDTIRILGMTAVALTFCAQSYRSEGKLELARDALSEAARLWREVQARCGKVPSNVDGLAATLEELRGVEDQIAGLPAS